MPLIKGTPSAYRATRSALTNDASYDPTIAGVQGSLVS